ncbi:MAG: hypothetical protein M3Q24_01875 [bacterium]|nr:hypothetical protein [bacterium]
MGLKSQEATSKKTALAILQSAINKSFVNDEEVSLISTQIKKSNLPYDDGSSGDVIEEYFVHFLHTARRRRFTSDN